ncbi:uncharacterized protein LOC126284621 [Schistocerca gregaria]|uniref:uncharacterized protein LOC126284621 n=1 Tax=Schistocerca gregaria TaxID=7010 RepID=UPI00211EB356|nr:uncharacterized protein LOC126284621 [Schistocerca gregaria]
MEQLMQALIEQQTQLTATIQAQQTQLTATIQALSSSLTHRLSSSSPPPFPPYDEAAEDWEDYEKRLRQHFLAFGVVDAPMWVVKALRGRRLCEIRTGDGTVVRHYDQMRPRVVATPVPPPHLSPPPARDASPVAAADLPSVLMQPPSLPLPSTPEPAPVATPPSPGPISLEHTPRSMTPMDAAPEFSPIISSRRHVPRTSFRPGHFRPYSRVSARDLLGASQEAMDVSALSMSPRK